MACMSFKEVKGIRYVYWSHKVDGRWRETYCGRASDPEAMRKARGLELAGLRDRRKELLAEIAGVDRRMAEIRRIDGTDRP